MKTNTLRTCIVQTAYVSFSLLIAGSAFAQNTSGTLQKDISAPIHATPRALPQKLGKEFSERRVTPGLPGTVKMGLGEIGLGEIVPGRVRTGTGFEAGSMFKELTLDVSNMGKRNVLGAWVECQTMFADTGLNVSNYKVTAPFDDYAAGGTGGFPAETTKRIALSVQFGNEKAGREVNMACELRTRNTGDDSNEANNRASKRFALN
jgi:hypothetical protein